MKQNKALIPLLSLVIPTRNRMAYVISAIQSILEIRDYRLELVIEDNSDSCALGSWLDSNVRDPRLRYNFSEFPRSTVDNFNAAAKRATGEYICFIGDDDGVNPEIVEAACWAKHEELDSLSPSQCAIYCWPDFRHWLYADKYSSKLRITPFTQKVKQVDAAAEVAKYIHSPRRDVGGLPKIYHGLIRRRCVDELVRNSGACFFGISPDVSGAIAIAHHVKNFWIVDYPLVIAGSSGRSAAGRGAMGTHKGSLRTDPHMRGFKDLEWPQFVPLVFCVETTLAEAAIEGLKAVGDTRSLDNYNYIDLYALCLVYHPNYMREIAAALTRYKKAHAQNLLFLMSRMALSVLRVFAGRANRFAWRILHPKPGAGEHCIFPIPDIREASRALTSYLENTGTILRTVYTRRTKAARAERAEPMGIRD